MSKVISLADRRTKRLAIPGWRSEHQAPANRPKYDAWVELDGTLVVRFARAAVAYQEQAATWGGEPAKFTARADGYEVRFAPIDVAEFSKDMARLRGVSQGQQALHRGDHLWRCAPNGDGTYTVEHDQQKAVFEPFSPRMRRGLVPDGPITPGWQRVKPAPVLPKCTACKRDVQIGETMYRERRETVKPIHGEPWLADRKFGGSELCATCIQRAPGEGIREAGGAK